MSILPALCLYSIVTSTMLNRYTANVIKSNVRREAGVFSVITKQEHATQKSSTDSDVFATVGKNLTVLSTGEDFIAATWMPHEYADLLPPNDGKQAVQATLTKYSLFFIVTDPAKPARTTAWIRDNCTLVLSSGEKVHPLNYGEVDVVSREFIDEIKGGYLSNAEKFATRVHVVVFSPKDKTGARLLNPIGTGSFQIVVNKTSAKYVLPLKGFVTQQRCVGCSYELASTWKYCPSCGKKVNLN